MAATVTPAGASPDPAEHGEEHVHAGPGGVVFWLTAALGAAIVLFGIRGLLENEPRGAESAIRWFIGGALVLDLVVVPSAPCSASRLAAPYPSGRGRWSGPPCSPAWCWSPSPHRSCSTRGTAVQPDGSST